MKKYLLFIALACVLGNRALAQSKASFSETVTEVMDFTGLNDGNNISYTAAQNYITGVGSRSYVSQLEKVYYLSVGENNNGNWRIGQYNGTTCLMPNGNQDLYIHNVKMGDIVTVWIEGQGQMASNNTNINQGTTLSGEVELRMVDNTIIQNEGRIKLQIYGNSGIKKIQIQTTKPNFNYDRGYEVYDFFQIGGGNNNAYTGCSTTDAAGFKLNGNDAYYLSLPNTDLSLNDRIAVSQKTGWSIARGIRAPGYNDGGNDWYNVSICNLREGDRVEIFYTGDAPTISSNGQNGAYTGSAGYKDVKNDGVYNADEGDQMFSAGMSLEGLSSRNEGNLSNDENTIVLLYRSFAYVMTEDGHLDLGLKNGNHTRILKVKIYSDHQATMIDEDVPNTHSTRAFFDITGELQAKEHIIPGGLEVRVGNEDKDQHAIVVSSNYGEEIGQVSYVNAVDGFKLPGITKENNQIQINFNLGNNSTTGIPTTGTFYKFIPQVDGKMTVRFKAYSMNYYRYDLAGDAAYYDEEGWLTEFDRANEQTLDLNCPYYVKVSYYGDAGNEIDWLPNNNVLTIDDIAGYNPDDSDNITFYIENVTNSSFGCLSGYNWTNQTNFSTNETGSLQFTYTYAEIKSIAGGTGVIEVHFWNQGNGTLSRVTLTTSSNSPSSTGTVNIIKGAQAKWDGSDQAKDKEFLGNGADGKFELHVEAGKVYYLYGGWDSNSNSSSYNISPRTNDKHACGVAELFDVTFTPDKDVHPLAKWVKSGTSSDEDLATIIGYEDDEITVKKMSGNITGCEPYIDGDKLKIRNITFAEDKNPGGVILIKIGDPEVKSDPVYAFTVAYDADEDYDNELGEGVRGHVWDFSTNSLNGLTWDPKKNGKPTPNSSGIFVNDLTSTSKYAATTDYGTYYVNYFNHNLNENNANGGSLLWQEMNYEENGIARSDWMFNYRLQIGDENHDPRFLNKYDIEGDNADMMWDTEGLIFQTSSNQSCMFNEFIGTVQHSESNDPDRYIGILPGGTFRIPWLDKNDRVIIYMGSGEGNGLERMVFNITNARDAVYKEITSTDEYIAGGSQWTNEGSSNNNYRGCYHFFAKEDGDMVFELVNGSMCKIYKIQIYHGDRIITNDIVGATADDKFLLTSTDKDPNDASSISTVGASSNWKLKYLGKEQQLANGSGKNEQDNEIIAKTGKYSSTTPALTDNHEDSEDNTSKVVSFTYKHSLGEIGTFRVRGKDMEKNMNYVADYADHNVTIAYQQTQKYPYTWDFKDMTGFGEQDFKDEDAIEPTMPSWFNNENAWRKSYEKTSEDLSLWETQTEEGGYYLRLNSQTEPNTKDNIFETAKDIDGNQLWANGQVVPETQGLWFYTNNNNQRNGGLWIVSNDGMELNGNNNWPYKLVVPNVPANAAVYLRMRTDNDYPYFEYLFDGGNTSCEVYQPTDPVEGNEYIFAIMNKGSKRNLTLSFGGYQLKKLAVSEDKKTLGKYGWATESRERIIDPSLTNYFSGKNIETIIATSSDYASRTVTLERMNLNEKGDLMQLATDGSNYACILHNKDAEERISILDGGFHLFIPDMHDYDVKAPNNSQKKFTLADKSIMKAQLSAGTVSWSDDEGTTKNFVLTSSYLKVGKEDNVTDNTLNAAKEEGFYRVGKNSPITSSGHQGYLPVSTEVAGGYAKFSIVFIDDIFTQNQGIATEIGNASSDENVNENNAEWYNMKGQKLNGMPTERGIYIVNGKKVLVK